MELIKLNKKEKWKEITVKVIGTSPLIVDRWNVFKNGLMQSNYMVSWKPGVYQKAKTDKERFILYYKNGFISQSFINSVLRGKISATKEEIKEFKKILAEYVPIKRG